MFKQKPINIVWGGLTNSCTFKCFYKIISIIFLLLNLFKIVHIFSHCKSLTVTLIFAFFVLKENEGRVEFFIFFVISIMQQIQLIESLTYIKTVTYYVLCVTQ